MAPVVGAMIDKFIASPRQRSIRKSLGEIGASRGGADTLCVATARRADGRAEVAGGVAAVALTGTASSAGSAGDPVKLGAAVAFAASLS